MSKSFLKIASSLATLAGTGALLYGRSNKVINIEVETTLRSGGFFGSTYSQKARGTISGILLNDRISQEGVEIEGTLYDLRCMCTPGRRNVSTIFEHATVKGQDPKSAIVSLEYRTGITTSINCIDGNVSSIETYAPSLLR